MTIATIFETTAEFDSDCSSKEAFKATSVIRGSKNRLHPPEDDGAT